MKTDSAFSFNNVLLPGTILLAHIDVTGLLAYGLKAALGGVVWLGIKMLGEKLEERRKANSEKKGTSSTTKKHKQ
ncbi:hypothetical protein [Chitinophaga hostae]|uniref:hypothetical protein n=1 Tax=Chitinophaga hostae TaxID=2831022 RepID=UPI003F69CE63